MTDGIRQLGYGDQQHQLDLPETAEWVVPASSGPVAAAKEMIAQALRHPIGLPPLREFARGKRSATILVSGKDRITAADVAIPLLLEELNAAGIPDEAIEICLATGTHARHTPEEAAALFGKGVCERIRWREHDARDTGRFVKVGTTSRGTEALFDRRTMETDLKILTGRIVPHYFAGFSGGRKALLPGVAAFQTICGNHRLTLDAERGIHRAVAPCSLEGNPVHLDMLEAAGMVNGTYIFNTVLDAQHRLVGAYAGEMTAAHRAGCAHTARVLRVPVKGPVDALITSAGGAPYDGNFMQSIKAVFNTQAIVKPGGAILWISECAGGIHDGFLRWAQIKSDAELDRSVRANYDLTGHNSIMLRRLVRHARVALWSALPDAAVNALGLTPVHSPDEGLAWLDAETHGSKRLAVVPYANVTCATTGA